MKAIKRLKIFQVDAFAGAVFQGNPAAVCPLDAWLEDETLQAIAMENNLSETAFFVPDGDAFHLRWFTPACEVNLCGHATLATAFVIFTELQYGRDAIEFRSRSGPLRVSRRGELLTMDFPAYTVGPCVDQPAALRQGLGREPLEVLSVGPEPHYLCVYGSEAEVAALAPDFPRLASLDPACVSVTAPGTDVDFVSRYFAPSKGIAEDPVTGSIHCALVPYWSRRLNRRALRARQVLRRGGELELELLDGRVLISGRAVKYLEGEILV